MSHNVLTKQACTKLPDIKETLIKYNQGMHKSTWKPYVLRVLESTCGQQNHIWCLGDY